MTVRGEAVARVVRLDEGRPRTDVDREAIRGILATAVDDDLAHDLDAAEASVVDE